VLPPGFSSPIEVKEALIYRDDGTIGITVEDARGQKLSFCLDGRLKEQTFWTLFHDTSKDRALYLGGLHPSDPQAQKLIKSGEIEGFILIMLQDWLKRQYPSPEELKGSIKAGLVTKVVEVLKNRSHGK